MHTSLVGSSASNVAPECRKLNSIYITKEKAIHFLFNILVSDILIVQVQDYPVQSVALNFL